MTPMRRALALTLLVCAACSGSGAGDAGGLSTLVVAGTPGPTAPGPTMTTEDLIKVSDLIVLGRVTAREQDGIYIGPQKELFTRHTFKVETSYKGKASDEVALLTRGGVEKQVVGGQVLRTISTQLIPGEGVRVDEELLVEIERRDNIFPEIDYSVYAN